MSYKIIFGTDGWRGFVAEDYTFDNVRRCAQGFANYLIETRQAGTNLWLSVTTSALALNILRQR